MRNATMDLRNKKVTVTGGLGLIGSFLVERLCKIGAKVTIIDNESNGSWRYLEHLRDNIQYIQCDLTKNQVEMGEYVFHLASIMRGIAYSQDNAKLIYGHDSKVNINVIESIQQSNTIAAVFASSACIYSDSCDIMDDTQTIFGPEVANYSYGHTKIELERMASHLNIPIATVRPSNVYGERYNWKGTDSALVPSLVKKVLVGGEIEIWGSGNQRRNLIHANDCARIMIKLLGYNTIVNIGHEKSISIIELAKKIAVLGKVGISIRRDQTKPEGKKVKIMSSEKLAGLIGQVRWTTLDRGLGKMIQWAKNQ